MYALVLYGETLELIGGFWPFQYCMDRAAELGGMCVSPEVLLLLNN